MKRHRQLFGEMACWSNLLAAARRARAGKRARPDVAQFDFEEERELHQLLGELRAGCYQPGAFRTFEVYDPKHRLISAAPYRDRVVHHAICNVIAPLFDRGFIFDTYGCRLGKGTHAAVRRARRFARRYQFALKTDIAGFFPSIDHDCLNGLLRRRIADERLLRLLDRVIRHPFPGQRKPGIFPGDTLFTPLERTCGLPIGNQTSQFFGNLMLDPIDHFIKEDLRCRGYVRYMDDLLLFGASKSQLWQWKEAIRRRLLELRLRLHPRKTNLFRCQDGLPYLGFRVFPDKLLIPAASVHRLRRRMRRLQQAYAADGVAPAEIRHRVASWWGHLQITGASQLMRHLLFDHAFIRAARPEPKESR